VSLGAWLPADDASFPQAVTAVASATTTVRATVGQPNGDLLGVLDHVGVGEDQTIVGDDEARALAAKGLRIGQAAPARQATEEALHQLGLGPFDAGTARALDVHAHHRRAELLHDGAVVGRGADRQLQQRRCRAHSHRRGLGFALGPGQVEGLGRRSGQQCGRCRGLDEAGCRAHRGFTP